MASVLKKLQKIECHVPWEINSEEDSCDSLKSNCSFLFCESYEQMNTLCRQSKGFMNIKAGGAGCGRNNSHILKVYKNQMKQGTQKILLFIKSTYEAIFVKDF